jgi:6-phospho-beta-glucosidase
MAIPLTIRNNGSLEDLDPNDAVEVPCEVASTGIRPRKVGRAPEVVRDLLLQVKEYERLTVGACVHHSNEAALAALVKNPLVGRPEVAHDVLSEYLQAFADQMHLHAISAD